MVMNESNENYLETILVLNHRLGNVRSVDIANEMNFKKPSVSVAMKNLRENGYITVSPEGYIHLTESGLEVAEKIYERHTILSNWLTMLGVDPRVAAEDACKIEHDISQQTYDAISVRKALKRSSATSIPVQERFEAVRCHIHFRTGKISSKTTKMEVQLKVELPFFVLQFFLPQPVYRFLHHSSTRANSAPQGAITSLPSAKTMRYA